jgi:SAM-dependent methyltransferase
VEDIVNRERRDALKWVTLFGALLALDGALPVAAQAAALSGAQNGYALQQSSNFKAVYGNPQLKAAFYQFLQNVYHLYPEQRFHQLIAEVSAAGDNDRDIYRLAQTRLGEIKPVLGDVRYALPALAQQKREMAREMLGLLGPARKIDGYMEIGTTGRYISQFRSELELKGDLVLLHTDAAGYSPVDLAERGRLFKLGRFVALNDYAPVPAAQVADGSLDLISNFIGFHHSPPDHLDGFVRSLHRALRPGGRMIVRDHDVSSGDMNRMVALAHDVFNMGLGADWSLNQAEIRNFTSIAQLTAYLEQRGFKSTGKQTYQPGDPTHNALMEFVRV